MILIVILKFNHISFLSFYAFVKPIYCLFLVNKTQFQKLNFNNITIIYLHFESLYLYLRFYYSNNLGLITIDYQIF